MSAEDLPVAVYSENTDEESSDTTLSGIILIPQENDEVESEAQGAATENKYVMHEVIIEIKSEDDIKNEITLLDENSALDMLHENSVPDMLDENSVPDMLYENSASDMLDENSGPDMLDENSAPDMFDENSVPDMLDENSAPDMLDENSVPDMLNENSAPDMLDENSAPDMFDENSVPDILEENSAPDITLEEVKDANESTVPNNNTESIVYQIIQDNEEPEHIDADHESRPTRTIFEERVMPPVGLKGNVQLFTEDTGPQMYKAKGPMVTAPIITKNLPKVFEYLPIHGRPQDRNNLKEFFSNKIREFVGCGLTDFEFQQLEEYCSPEQLKTGNEMVMETNVPVMGVLSRKIVENLHPPAKGAAQDLCILKKNKMRMEKDSKGHFTKKLKYRGVRSLPFTQEVYHLAPLKPTEDTPDVDLEPGKDILYRVRVYRPYTYSQAKTRFTRTRHSVFCCDIVLTGRNKLSDLRDRIVCHNDFDMRVDVSNHPDVLPSAKAKEVFPSGFLFINNVFYVDTREGCVDYSELIREWARKKGFGVFPKQDMCAVRLEELVLKLGYPEVYVHQGNCEHAFLFSEIRLLGPTDPLRLFNYPCTTSIGQNQTVYCTTCAEFSAKWIVVGCSRVPFDPAFFCETCFRQYLYKDGEKIGDFKAYSYRGNALNVLKPQ